MPLNILSLGSYSLFHAWMIILLILGFGFVIFWHELGHFLAAKAVGIKVEQFAVGFGQALFAWRKGVGLRWGNTQKAYYEQIEKHLDEREKQSLKLREKGAYTDRQMSDAAAELGLGDTEYRLNWIPLGGYVKMLGQDDLRPDAAADDPRAYTRKSVSARMLVISAGVIMNVILAAIMFVAIFMIGLKAPPAWVGRVVPHSPAQAAGLKVGDQIMTFNGHAEQDFTKIKLDTALAKPDATVPITVKRKVDGVEQTVTMQIKPERSESAQGFVAMGFEPPNSLDGPKLSEMEGVKQDWASLAKQMSPGALLVRPGDVITAINGKPVNAEDKQSYVLLDQAAQSYGKPVELKVRAADGQSRKEEVQPHFSEFFNGQWSLAGLEPRAGLVGVQENSTAFGKLLPGDAISKVIVHAAGGDQLTANPDLKTLIAVLRKAGSDGSPFDVEVIRGADDKVVRVDQLRSNTEVGSERGQKGLGVTPALDEQHAIVGGTLPGTPAATAGVAGGDSITGIDGQPVKNWYDVHRLLSQANPGSVALTYQRAGQEHQTTLKLNSDAIAAISNITYSVDLPFLKPVEIVRKAPNALVAAEWGVLETRDFILQFYVTLQRMFGGSVNLSSMMGPVGIFRSGINISYRGYDWLLWFLAMISANLAVVNFLPIPVVDGGQFTFLIIEKIKGKPISPRTMAIAQYSGLAFLAAVVVFVTYHDLMRRY